MQNPNYSSKTVLFLFRGIFYFLALYFFLMGVMLVLFPQILTKVAGTLHPVILGMLRGAGGSIIPYSLIYIFIARKPLERRWAAYIIALANLIAISLDLYSIAAGEYRIAYALIDIPFESVSLIMIIVFYSILSSRKD